MANAKPTALEDFFRLAFEEKLTVKMPERETDHLTAASKVLEKRREMNEVELALNAQKEEFQMKVESLQQRKDDLEKKELQLKESLVKFDKFLKENEVKRQRASKKAHDEKDLAVQKEKDIKKLETDAVDYVVLREKLANRLEKQRVYQEFLDQLVSKGEDFTDVNEVVKRWTTLSSAGSELFISASSCQKQLDDVKQDFKTFIDEKNNQIVGYNNTLAGLQSKLDSAVAETMNLETKWTHIKNTAARKTLTMGKIKVAIHNLYALVERHMKMPALLPGVEEDDDEEDQSHHHVSSIGQDEQLETIGHYLANLQEVVAEVKRLQTQPRNELSLDDMLKPNKPRRKNKRK